MTALSGLSEILYKKLPQLSSEQLKSHIKDISNSSSSIHELVTNLLEWSRTQSQNLVYEPVELNVHELVMRNIFLSEIQLTSKNISCHINIDSAHTVFADKHMVDTIVRNLINNGIKFTHRNGSITITSQQSATDIIVIFSDTGIGMSAEQIQEIQHHENRSISYGTLGETGTRLGLHLIKEFIEINKGTINIESELGKGSAFSISLPKSVHKEPGLKMSYNGTGSEIIGLEKISFQEEELGLLKGKRILIVDDNTEIRNFLKLLLSGTFEIFEARNGADGFQTAKESQPDLIITDMMMPVMNGLEFCQQIKGNYNTSHIPVVLLTSNTGEDGQLAAYEVGSDAFLAKPIHQRILFRVLLNLIINQESIKKKFAVSDDLLPDGISLNKLDEEFLEKISNYVIQNISETDLDYKKLCDLTVMSRTVLYAKFKTLTGMGVHDFIKNIRLKKSITLLQEGKLNISQIAYEVGFATPSYFTKSFAKRYNIGPKDYVLRLKNKVAQQKESFPDEPLGLA